MTSRSEYRLVLRQDNADFRMMPIGHKLGLISDVKYQKMLDKYALVEAEIDRLKHSNLSPTSELNQFLENSGTAPLSTGCKIADLIRRPQLGYDVLAPFDSERPELSDEIREQVEIQIKYEGYINRQYDMIQKAQNLEQKKLPQNFDYHEIHGLRLEAIEKLNKHQPVSIGQASRISGVSPADVSVLLIWLTQNK